MIGLSFDILSILGREASKVYTINEFLLIANKKIEIYQKEINKKD